MKRPQEVRDKISKNNAKYWAGKKRAPISEETRRKMSEARIGKRWKCSEQAKQNMSLGKKKFYEQGGKSPRLGAIVSEEVRERIKEKLSGKKLSKEARLKRSITLPNGPDHHGWKGGVSKESEKVRKSIESRLWREAVFARDNWTCQKTGKRGVKLHCHHIKNFSQHPELRFAIDNGISLSEEAHKEFHKIYGKNNNNELQLKEFLCHN